MNIQKLLEALSENEKKELLRHLNSEKVKIVDFIKNCRNERLKIALTKYIEIFGSVYIDEVIFYRFNQLPNVGKKTWYDFQELIL